MITETNTLNLDRGIGQRSTTYRFDIIDGVTGAYRGELHPSRGSTPSLSHDTTSTISRRLQGLTLFPEEAALFRPLVDRIALTMVIDGIGEYPLGRYVASDDVRTVQSDGVTGALASIIRPLSLYDEMFIIDQKLSDSFAAGGVLISEVIKTLLEELPIIEPRIDGCSETSDAGWSAGTSRATALKDLCTAGGYFAPWFDHTGTLRCIQAFDPAATVPTINFDTIPRVMRGSITLTDESVSAPNRFVVVSNDTGISEEPIVGIYDISATAPNSILNRGFVLPDVRDVQVTSSAQAQIYARTLGIQNTIVEKLECDTTPDPRHDAYDVVRFLGENWLEIGWTITLSGNGTMRHVLNRTYPVSDEEI
jgi:hypothetical protein